MSENTAHHVGIDTGHGDPSGEARPIKLFCEKYATTSGLSAAEADTLAARLKAAAQAVRVLSGKATVQPVSAPTVRTAPTAAKIDTYPVQPLGVCVGRSSAGT